MIERSGGVGDEYRLTKADRRVGVSKDTDKGSGNLHCVSGPTANTGVDLDCPRRLNRHKKHPVRLSWFNRNSRLFTN